MTEEQTNFVVPEAAVAIITRFEGLSLTPYKDAAGVTTIGYGHTGQGVFTTPFTKEDAIKLLREDLREAAEAVTSLVEVPINDNQLAALISFTFNLGRGNLSRSTLLRKLNAEDYVGAANEFQRWVKAGSTFLEPLPGLLRRRGAEEQLFRMPPPTEVAVNMVPGPALLELLQADGFVESLEATTIVFIRNLHAVYQPQGTDETDNTIEFPRQA